MADAVPPILTEALAAHGNGDLTEAESLYRRVLALEPGNAEALHNLGVVGLQSGYPAAAAIPRNSVSAAPTQKQPKHTKITVAAGASQNTLSNTRATRNEPLIRRYLSTSPSGNCVGGGRKTDNAM